MNRQTSVVTSRCQVSEDENTIEKTETKRRVLLPNPAGDGDRNPAGDGDRNPAGVGDQIPVGVGDQNPAGVGDRGVRNQIVFEPNSRFDSNENPVLTSDECGFFLVLSKTFRIDVVANGGFRVYSYSSKTAAYFNNNGDEVGVISPHGRVHKYKDVVTGLIGDKMVKMSSRGVTFTAEGKPIVYLVDAAGCKSTRDKFKYLTGDITSQMLLRHKMGLEGREIIQKVMDNIRRKFSVKEDIEQDLWCIGDFVFTLTSTGHFTICRPNTRFFIAIDPEGQVKVKIDRMTLILRNQFSSFVKFPTRTSTRTSTRTTMRTSTTTFIESGCTLSVDQSVKVQHSRLTAKCASQRAVLDQKNQLLLSSIK